MITGTVTLDREATLRLKVQGLTGREREIDAVIDTGFTGQLILPLAVIEELGLSWLTQAQAVMANGQIETFDVYSAFVSWDGQILRVMAEDADTEPLIGMSLLFGHK